MSWNPGGQMAGRWATPDLRLHLQVDRTPLAWAGNCPSPGRLRATERALCPQRLVAWSTLCAVAQEAGRTREGGGGAERARSRKEGPGGSQGEEARVRALRDRRDFRRRKGILQEGAGTALAGSECCPALGKTPWETRECELRAGSAGPSEYEPVLPVSAGDADKPLKLLRASVSSSVQKQMYAF